MRRILSIGDEARVLAAIHSAELQTSGEVRVHLEHKCEEEEVLDRAAWLFKELGMEKTEQRNGVLIYIATKSKRFAIIGDCGINNVVPDNFWDSACDAMIPFLRKGEYANALEVGITQVGELLKEKFPYQTDDVNELPDSISYGN